ncbi:hypothetical protein L2719_14860 [Shewanella schlegeliana]|uniref:3-phosphoshikimate 1-carboxyvinyltransferase n=1 Tax=Shewanella schlegeliana TaxID=190308 RepID=A0ABS1T042_9GAMM|nr:hypothetical protein [Shewanella schlegeliana]MBL4914148.1 hypothetical protein [Shewanella schlegeliana]MCL1110815.1 hypothetical protein [Shewanella schlegeliana]GIU36400.1 hypothetical protein TUM4433_35110 [Shewanella schlegeliana]
MPTEYLRPSLKDDIGVNRALGNMPKVHADSFSEPQLLYLRRALINNRWQKHMIDSRGSFYLPFIGWRFFYVFLFGRNKRAYSRKEKQLSLALFLLSIVAFILISIAFGLLLLYLLKSMLGIDLFEGTSLEIWDWFKTL